MVGTLGRIFGEASAAMAGPQGNPAKRRELEANSKKLGALFVRLNARDVSASVGAKLVQLCAALDNRDYAAALRIQASAARSLRAGCILQMNTTLKQLPAPRLVSFLDCCCTHVFGAGANFIVVYRLCCAAG